MKEGYDYDVRCGWQGRPESPASVGTKFIDTLDALSRIDPVFSNWTVTDFRRKASLALDEARLHIDAIVGENVIRGDFGEPEPIYGYHVVGQAGKFKDPRSMKFIARAGGKFESVTILEPGTWNISQDLSIVTYPIFKAALLAINAIWLAPWACAYAFRSNTVQVPESYPGGVQGYSLEPLPMVPSDPTFPDSVFQIPWFVYLSAPLAAGLDVPPEILTERAPDGGILMIVTEERLDPTNPAQLRRARTLAETMIARVGP
jgi:hypothetical protein